jgi:putative transposase
MAHDISVADPTWREQVARLPPALLAEYHGAFTSRWLDLLDAGYGACALRDPALAELVAASLRHFHGIRYSLHDYVVMPNHVHLLASFPDPAAMRTQVESWKHYTAAQINRRLGATGRFWQPESFDHLVRHEAQFLRLRAYIRDNPVKARLHPGEYLWWSKVADSLRESSAPKP